MTLVAGIDSSTQSCKIVIREAETGALVRSGSAKHPEGTEVNPQAWWDAFLQAVEAAGGLNDVAAAAVGGQQHGLVALDAEGEVIRDALLWNDTRSAAAAEQLILEYGEAEQGPAAWSRMVGSVPVASLTVTKLRWLADAEPQNARRIAAVALPHDWLTWKISGSTDIRDLATDRSEVSGTGYFDPALGQYRYELLAQALRISQDQAERIVLPEVAEPSEQVGTGDASRGWGELVLGPGAGDNAAASLGLGMSTGDVSISIGTSGVVAAVSPKPIQDPTGVIAGFSSATGEYLPLAVTLNGSRVLDGAARMLGTDHAGLAELALASEPGANGLGLVPYLEGERTPNFPHATGSFVGLSLTSMNPQDVARASVEGLLCGLADGLEAMTALGVPVNSIQLIGGAAKSPAVQQIAPAIFEREILVPEPGEYVADGAARQAAWVLTGTPTPPDWTASLVQTFTAEPARFIRERYAERRHLFAERS
ncbi:xylulose kinase [Nesterenkonia sp. MY13]|uniref:Xylulose kinase n=1 Tax=Nesterenkonia sedimenti TaxID=1463632 RepID=A0A7X8TJ72_9MICC|nr:FGGY family carbohydrate kinase [Nesterenkonia sedimenti]NLS09738.1 xylulose kinase [Nesterenkonia sedimenti]